MPTPPKSVSLVGLLGGDERVRDLHHAATQVALRELEQLAAVRVRQNGARTRRPSGNVVAALFTHETSRALDPHLHTHAIVFNASRDPVEDRWKALENEDILRARGLLEEVYYHELARGLRGLGYALTPRARGDFEITGVPEELCRRFSKRHAEIDQALARLLDEKPDLGAANLKALRARLATAERARKQKDLPAEALHGYWAAQTTAEERLALQTLRASSPKPEKTLTPEEAVQWAEEHLFERHSVVPEALLWQTALRRAFGADLSLADVQAVTRTRDYLRDPTRVGWITTPEVLAREAEIIRLTRAGVSAYHPLSSDHGPLDPRLDAEQLKAAQALLGTRDLVTVFRGGAGTGKSFVLRQVVDRITDRPVVVVAPQRQQVVEMEKGGFPAPRTVSHLVTRRDLPERAVLVVDEAGQIGGRQMLELLQLAVERYARVILSGDTRQHGPIEASDALRAMETHAGLRAIELSRIRRQDPNLGTDFADRRRIRQYRAAVAAAARGDLGRSYALLQSMGAVQSCSIEERPRLLAAEFVRWATQGSSSVVVSQTWSEVHRLNTEIRAALKAKGILGTEETVVEALERVDLTSAQKRDRQFYPDNAVVLFNRPIRSAPRGATGKLAGVLGDGIAVEVGGRLVTVRSAHLDKITVCQPRPVPLSRGDRLQLKGNRSLSTGGKVNNGELVTVEAVQGDGAIRLQDGRVLGPDFREFLPGYAVTSYGSQGKTVDHVLLSDSQSRPATHAQQWYVSISRGRRGIQIFTSDPEGLQANISRSGDRPLALDLALRPLRRNLKAAALRQYLSRFGTAVADRLRKVLFVSSATARRLLFRHEQQNH